MNALQEVTETPQPAAWSLTYKVTGGYFSASVLSSNAGSARGTLNRFAL